MGKNRNRDFDAGKTTKTGEMVPSLFNWKDPDLQRQITKHLATVTEKKSQ